MIVHMLMGGEIFVIDVNGHQVSFEDHPQCGPTPVHPRTFSILTQSPSKAFWDAIERWMLGGKSVDGIVALAPPWCATCNGSGLISDPGDKRCVIACRSCKGRRVG